MQIDLQQEIFKTSEVAELLRVDRLTVLRYIKQGKIKALRIGNTVRIHRSQIAYLLPERKEVQ